VELYLHCPVGLRSIHSINFTITVLLDVYLFNVLTMLPTVLADEVSSDFLQASHVSATTALKVDHNLFVPHPFQFINYSNYWSRFVILVVGRTSLSEFRINKTDNVRIT